MSRAALKNEIVAPQTEETANALASPATSGRESFWFVARGETLKGPYTIDQLKAAMRKHDVSVNDFCWRQGFREWRPISVTEAGSDGTMPSFPSITHPGQTGAAAAEAITDQKKPKHIKVSFSKIPRYSITIYEWALAILFACALSYTATHYALREVQDSVARQLDVRQMDKTVRVGSPKDAHVPNVRAWDPVLSAPNLKMLQESNDLSARNPFTEPLGFRMSATVSGHLMPGPKGTFTVEGVTVAGADALLKEEHEREQRLDPAYARTFAIYGELNSMRPEEIRVNLSADAILDVK